MPSFIPYLWDLQRLASVSIFDLGIAHGARGVLASVRSLQICYQVLCAPAHANMNEL